MRRHAKASSAGSSHGTGRARKGLLGIACLCLLGLVAFVGSGASTASADDACPNEAVRAESNSLALPECRAYELVSNPFKEGYPVFPTSFTDDGSALQYQSAGNFLDNGLGGTNNSFVATRSASGWKGVSYNPSGPTYLNAAGAPIDVSADLKLALWRMRLPGESTLVADYYLRSPDGSFQFVGPAENYATFPQVAPGPVAAADVLDYYGSSADLSHIAYNVPILREFPGDTNTSFPGSLYEYVGTGNTQPRLVGVNNSGQLVSNCGTLMGRRGHSVFHAISTDGRVIFFSPQGKLGDCAGPPATEVWARVDGTTSYRVSKSLCTRTAADLGGACNARTEAMFEGASADGSRVFFTTAQQLVNGDTDATTDLYEYDLPTPADPNPSPPLTEVSGSATEANVQGVSRISDDGSRVYFVAKGVLAANNGANNLPAVAGSNNLYVWERDASHPAGETKFVGPLLASDSILWGYDNFRPIETTTDGRYMVLSTYSPLTSTDTDHGLDTYRYDAVTGELTRVSTATSGIGGNEEGKNAGIPHFLSYSAEWKAWTRSRYVLSADGETILFTTAEALSPNDVNAVSDLYAWHAGHVSLISPGRTAMPVENGFLAESGSNIFFSSNEAITPDDGDTTTDIYDARVDGGFSFLKPPSCTGEACQPRSGPPATSSPATDRANGSGNVVAATASVKTLTASQRAKLASGAKVQLEIKVSQPGKVIVKGTAKFAGKQRQVFFSSLKAKGAGEVKLPISLSKGAREQLKSHGSLTVRLSVRFAGAAPQTSKLGLKAPKAKSGHSKRRAG